VVRGTVRSESGGAPLTNATVQLEAGDWSGAVTTDATGSYRIPDVPAGRSLVRVRHIGHEPLEVEVLVASGREVVLDLSLPVRPVALAPIRVDGRSPTAEADSIASSSADLGIVGAHALESSPGLSELGFADAIRGVPGQEPPDPGSVLYVRGATNDLKLVYLDGAPVYAPFPLGGLMEPFAPELLHQAEIYLGGAPARYDGGLSYVMDLRTRGGIVGGVRTSGSVDLLTARVLGEAGFGDRVRVIGTMRGMHPVASSGLFGDPLPYRYEEGVLRADVKLSETLSLSATGFSNAEAVRIAAASIADTLIQWGNRAASVRLRGTIGETSSEVTAAIGDYGARLPLAGTPPRIATGDARRSRLSADFSRRMDGLQLRYGGSYDRQTHTATASTIEIAPTTMDVTAEGEILGAYAEALGQVGQRISLRAGLRVDHFSGGGGFRFGPRAAATWLLTDRAALTIAAGGYHQFVRPPDELVLGMTEGFDVLLSPSLTVGRSSHFTIGLDQDIGEQLRLGVEAFFKSFSDVPGSASADANASGVDLWVRRSTGNLTGWLGYSLAWVWSANAANGPTEFVGRHLLSAGLGTPIGDRTRIDLRFAYGAGLPYSAIPLGTQTETLAAAAPNYPNQRTLTFADRGGTETAPLLDSPDEPFLRLDATLSQRWTARRGDHTFEISPYIRVLNGLGRRDALFYYFDSDADPAPREIGTLPIIPMVGLEWRF